MYLKFIITRMRLKTFVETKKKCIKKKKIKHHNIRKTFYIQPTQLVIM